LSVSAIARTIDETNFVLSIARDTVNEAQQEQHDFRMNIETLMMMNMEHLRVIESILGQIQSSGLHTPHPTQTASIET
jgi:superfamily II DNA/RNA helicase